MSHLENVKIRKADKTEYKVVQLTADVHSLLKDYCNQKGFIMSSFVANLIKKAVKEKNL